jgi:hypothetical protein
VLVVSVMSMTLRARPAAALGDSRQSEGTYG